jgi:hypothetical protein
VGVDVTPDDPLFGSGLGDYGDALDDGSGWGFGSNSAAGFPYGEAQADGSGRGWAYSHVVTPASTTEEETK